MDKKVKSNGWTKGIKKSGYIKIILAVLGILFLVVLIVGIYFIVFFALSMKIKLF